ncbi:signal peptide peptidase-domain-containing protein [Tirmania nivea]|nr:signal peptide peptidase-domain-containing protein [Tirmania nivea]
MGDTAADPLPLPKDTGALGILMPLIPTYAHLLLTALLPIVAGAHASLGRPNNVRPPSKKFKKITTPSRQGKPQSKEDKPTISSPQADHDDQDDDEEEGLSPVETLTPRDAMLFPVTAGILLGGLYLIIKYLDDPTILSKILTWYFALVGTFAVGKFCADSLGVVVSIVFPRQWSQVVGEEIRVYVAGHDRYKLLVSGEENAEAGIETEKRNPFPRSMVPIPQSLYAPIWFYRRALLARWAVVSKLGRGKDNTTRTTFWIGDIIGLIIGLVCVAGYVISGKHWIGTNIMGVSFAYGAMQLISPTTFGTATLLLSLLFFYDIYFVFYTPLMVTVATSLDVPIKLLFPRPAPEGSPLGKRSLAMLGLGDVVLPGIMIAMALRFDFWRWCEARKLKESKASNAEAALGAANTSFKAQLPVFIKPTGTWGERLWNCGAKDVGGVFPKTYFFASIGGYVAGMLTTLYVMHVWNHAQPALLYLVPGVLGAVWGTAVVRGEVVMAWGYTEEAEADDEEKREKKEEKKEKGKGNKGKTEEKTIVGKKAGEKQNSSEPSPASAENCREQEGGQDEVGAEKPVDIKVESEAVPAKDEDKKEADKVDEDDGIELVDESGEAEYISVRIVKKPAPGAAFTRC